MTSNNAIQFPHTPTRDDSTHPYAIVTTSTALLSRSNSSNRKLSHHSYSPSPLPKFSSPTSNRHDYRGHRHTRSCTSLTSPPDALPPPPSSVDEFSKVLRSGALTDYETSSESGNDTDRHLGFNHGDNPKLWDTTKLCEYLTAQNLHDLVDFVSAENLTGRAFLRFSPSCMSPSFADSLTDDQVAVILDQARKLRILALRSRIWGLQVSADHEDYDSQSPATSPVQRVKVKGMVQVFEKGGRLHNVRQRSDSTASSDSDWMPNASPLERRAASPVDIADQDGFASASEPDSDNYFLNDRMLDSRRSSRDTASQLRTPSPPIESVKPIIKRPSEDFNEEPSIEQLLSHGLDPNESMGGLSRSWGAKAWEEDDIGATARRIPLSPPPKERMSLDEFGVIGIKQFPVNEVDEEEDVNDRTSHPEDLAGGAQLANEIEKQDDITLVDSVEQIAIGTNSPESETVEELKARLAALEARIKGLEQSQVTEESRGSSDEPTAAEDMDLPQYILMAGVGVCAIIGQAVWRKFMRA